MHRVAAASCAGIACLLLAALPSPAANRGVRADGGDRFEGVVAPGGDVDRFVVPVTAGGKFSVDLRAATGSPLIPVLSVLAPSGAPSDPSGHLKGEGTRRLQLRNLPASVSGLWSVGVSGESGTAGGYSIAFRTKSPRKASWKGTAVPQAGTALFEAQGDDGARLSFSLVEREGGPVGGIEVRDPSGAPVAIPPGALSRKGKRLSLAGVPLASGYGTYAVAIAGAASGGTTVDASIAVKYARPPRRRAVLGPEPAPAAVAPSGGRDGTAVTISGSEFLAGARVYFGDTPADGVTVLSPSTIQCLAPDGPESRASARTAVSVANPDGQENGLANAFSFVGPPVLVAVAPAYSPEAGGLLHVLSGTGFRAGFSITVAGEVPAEATLVSGNQITFRGPAHAAGPVPVAVTDEFGRTGTLAGGITYVGPPTIVAATPPSVAFTGGRTITVDGTNFRAGAKAFLDGAELFPLTIVSPTRFRFTMPPGPAGEFDLAVRDEFGQETTAPDFLHRRGPFADRSATAVPSPPPGTDFFASSLALGDLDGDGLPDLVPATAYPATSAADGTPFPGSWILRNTGYFAFAEETAARHGSFTDPGDSGQASFAALGDLDGSPGAEVVLSMAYPSQAASPVFSANGKQYAYYFAAYYGNYVDVPTYAATRVLANDGTGVLSNATSAALPSGSSTPFFGWGERWQAGAGALGDLDGDGDLDLCLSAPVRVIRGTLTGASYYASGTTYLAEGYAYVAAARVLRNGGGGTFAAAAGAFPAPVYQSGTLVDSFEADAMALGDLDGDGDLDVVLSRSYPLGVYYQNPQNGYYYVTYRDATRVLANDGTGKFSFDASRVPASYGSTHPYSMDYWQADSLAVGDLDGDGDRDVVLGRSQSSYWYDTATYGYRFGPAIRILANDGKGFFTEATASFLPAKSFLVGSPDTILSAESVVLGDLDGDGSQDLVVAGTVYAVYDYAGTGYGYYGILPAGPVLATKVFLNDGRGGFADETKRWLPAPVNGDRFHSNAAALGDLDGDGDLDLILAADFYPDVAGTTAGHNRPIRVFETK